MSNFKKTATNLREVAMPMQSITDHGLDTVHTPPIPHTSSPSDTMRHMMSKLNVPADYHDDSDIPDASAPLQIPDMSNEPMPGMDDPYAEPPVPSDTIAAHIAPSDIPDIISREIALSDPYAVNPAWHAVNKLPGNLSKAILSLSDTLFAGSTSTPADDIVMIGNVGGQGPNTTREVTAVTSWIERTAQPIGEFDNDVSVPSYHADIKNYTVGGVRFKIVKDQFGDYIYAWPEQDSISNEPPMAPAAPTLRPGRSLLRR